MGDNIHCDFASFLSAIKEIDIRRTLPSKLDGLFLSSLEYLSNVLCFAVFMSENQAKNHLGSKWTTEEYIQWNVMIEVNVCLMLIMV